MALLKWFISTLLFCELIIHLNARICPKGSRVVTGSCAVCPPASYQPEENKSRMCKVCRRCDQNSGSRVKQECTSETNRECECLKGFVPADVDSSSCKCDRGFGKKNGECSKCEAGYFNNQIDSPCKEWRKCNAGVNVTGTDTSDNICNEESKTHVTTTTTSNKSLSQNKHGGAAGTETPRTRNKSATTTFTAKSAPEQRVTPKGEVQPLHPHSTDSHIGVIILMCVIALLTLTTVICMLFIAPRPGQRKPAVQTQDSLCRRPVEESGDGSQSSLKQHSEEP